MKNTKESKDKKAQLKKHKIDWDSIIGWIFIILIISVVIGLIALNIYGLIKYGGKPINEVPWWVWWLKFGGRR